MRKKQEKATLACTHYPDSWIRGSGLSSKYCQHINVTAPTNRGNMVHLSLWSILGLKRTEIYRTWRFLVSSRLSSPSMNPGRLIIWVHLRILELTAITVSAFKLVCLLDRPLSQTKGKGIPVQIQTGSRSRSKTTNMEKGPVKKVNVWLLSSLKRLSL